MSRYSLSPSSLLFVLTGLVLFSLPTAAATRSVPARYATIQAAINAAKDGDTVLIAAGAYAGVGDADLDFEGKNITVTSRNGAIHTVINCQGSSSANHRGFYLHSGETHAVISGLTIENGYESNGNGGGILDNGAGLIVRNCIIKDNTVIGDYSFGGGVYNINGSGPITLTDCVVEGNAASYGGGVYNFSNNSSGPIKMNGCILRGNMASTTCGGVYNVSFSRNASGAVSPIALTDCIAAGNLGVVGSGGFDNETDSGDSAITLTRCIARENMSPVGTGVFNENDGGVIQLTNCAIEGNIGEIGSGGGGGGVFNDSSIVHGTTFLTQCVIRNNSAFSSSGGLFNNTSTTTLTDCLITGNSSVHGSGGIANDNDGTITLINCALTGNTALSGNGYHDGYGGGIFNGPYGNTLTLTNCTLTGNAATYGGGIFNDGGTILLTNDILTGDTAASGGEIMVAFGMVTTVYCDVQGGYLGTGNINADPLFVNAPRNLHLSAGSPCLGAGTPDGAPTTTLDGQARPDPPSIGAYEIFPRRH